MGPNVVCMEPLGIQMILCSILSLVLMQFAVVRDAISVMCGTSEVFIVIWFL